MADSSKTAKGGMLVGVAAIITACIPLFLTVTSDTDDKAEKADDKAELVLDLFRDRFNEAQSERERIQRALEYQRDLNAKLFRMVAELRRKDTPSSPTPTPKPVRSGGGGGGDALTKAIRALPPEDQFDLPEPPPAQAKAPVQQKLPSDLEELLKK